MKYFIVHQEEKKEYSIEFPDFPTRQKAIFPRKEIERFRTITNLYVTGEKDRVFFDFYESPLLLVSDEVKKIWEWYEERLDYRTVVFTNLEQKIQKVYRLVLTEIVDALSEKTTYYKNGWEKHLVIKESLLDNLQIFHLQTKQTAHFIVSLDVAESMLKRGLQGFWLEEIETD